MTRIGLIVHGQPPELVGGTERLVAALGAALADAGQQVEIFSGSIEWRPRLQVVRDGSGPVPVVRVHRDDLFFERWDKLHDPFVERAYLRWLDEFAPEVVHVHHWARLTTTLVTSARRRGIPAVLTLHDLLSSCPRYHRLKPDLSFCTAPPGPEVCRRCAPRWEFQGDEEIDRSVERFVADLAAEVTGAAAVMAPTAGHGRRVLSWLGLDELEVTVVPPASRPDLRPASRPLGDRPASVETPLAVGSFGHLHPQKGLEVLLDALGRLPEPGRVKLHVWGEAPTPEMDAALKARAAGRRVAWHGAYAPEDLGGAPVDVVVLPTLCAESYSFTLDEAAALGVPVVASDLGALADRATARVALFPRGDSAALARVLADLAADPARRRAMAAAPAPPTIDMDEHVRRLLPVYAAAVARPPARAPRDEAGEEASLTRREHAFRLREAALHELLRSEGWEAVLTRLQAENEALRRRLGEG